MDVQRIVVRLPVEARNCLCFFKVSRPVDMPNQRSFPRRAWSLSLILSSAEEVNQRSYSPTSLHSFTAFRRTTFPVPLPTRNYNCLVIHIMTQQHALTFLYKDLLYKFHRCIFNFVFPLYVVLVQSQYCWRSLSIYRFIVSRLEEDGMRRDGRAIYAERGKLTVMRDGVTTGSVLPIYERNFFL